MSIYVGDKKAIFCKGDYRPAQFYKGATKIAGWNDVAVQGTSLSVPNTYNDSLRTLTASGKTTLSADWRGVSGTLSQVQTVQGKNLFNNLINKWEQGNIAGSVGSAPVKIDSTTVIRNNNYYLCPVNASTTYTLSSTTFGAYRIGFRELNSSGILTYMQSTVNTNLTFTTQATTAYIAFVIVSVTSGAITPSEAANISAQLELGSTATAYTPFVPNSPSPDYPSAVTTSILAGTYKIACPTGGWWLLTLADDVRGIGTYLDKIELDMLTGKGKLHKNIVKYTFTGNESTWFPYTFGCTSTFTTIYYDGLSRSKIGFLLSFCSHFKNITNGWDKPTTEHYSDHSTLVNKYFMISNDTIGVLSTDDNATRLTKFKTWLVTQYTVNPITVYYVTATEAVTNLTLTHVDTSDATELTLADLGITAQSPDYPYTTWGAVGNGNIVVEAASEIKHTVLLPTLESIGDYADTYEPCVMVDSVLRSRLTQRIGVRVFDGTESWAIGSGGIYTNSIRLFISESDVYADYLKAKGLCTHLPYLASYLNDTPGFCLSVANWGNITIVIAKSTIAYADTDTDLQIVAKVKSYLAAQYAAGAPVTVKYVLATPIITLGDPVSLETYYPETHIYSTSNLQGQLSATCRTFE